MSRINKKIVFSLIIFFFISLGSACAERRGQVPLNVIVIILNAARADHLKMYGYRRNTAPFIEEFAEHAAIFEQAFAQSYWTLPSEASLLTSRYVHSHRVYERNQRLPYQELTLPEILKIYGFQTAAFVGGLDTVASYGLNQGFDLYDDDTQNKPMGSFKDILPKALKWLKENKDNKFFLFIHGYDVHPPFVKPSPYDTMYDPGYKGIVDQFFLDYNLLKKINHGVLFLDGKTIGLNKRDINHIIARYDSGITYADAFLGEFLKQVDQMGLSGNTIIILTSDHGEELSDHGTFDRFGTKDLYEEVIHVPLIIKHPCFDLKPKRIKHQVQLIDIMPSILDFLGIPINKECQGMSLASLLKDEKAFKEFNQEVYSEATPDKWAVRTQEGKMIYNNGEYELYDLKGDPAESINLAGRNPGLVYELMQRSDKWLKSMNKGQQGQGNSIELSNEMKERLKKVGYW